MSALTTAPRVILVAGALALALAGCASPAPTPTTTHGTTSDAPSPSASSATFPTIAGADLSGMFTCDDLVQPSLLATAAPGFTEIANFEPDDASVASTIQDAGGIACGYQNAAGAQIVFAYAKPSAASQDALVAYYKATSQPTTSFELDSDIPTFFTVQGGYGEANVFLAEGYWINVGSKEFSAPEDAAPFVSSAVQDTPAG